MPCMAEDFAKEVAAMKKVACVGILVADIITEPVNSYPDKGVLLPVNSITLHNGGNAMTAAINIKKLGVETEIVGKVGTDIFGRFLKERLEESGVGVSGLCTDSETQTSTSVLMISDDGERSFFHCVGANGTFSEKDIDFSIIEDCDIVFVTGSFLLHTFDGKETAEFLKKCKKLGKTTFVDVCWDDSGRWGELLDMSMPYIDFFMPSIDEAVNIAKAESPEEAADIFIKKGVSNAVIKLGSKGCFLKTASMEKGIHFPSKKLKAVDTTGAGDSFCSGFIAAYAHGEDIKTCALIANETGGRSVLYKGATSWTADYAELKETVKEYNKC